MKPLTLKVDDKQLKLLNEISKTTHIPKSSLIRQGIDLILRQKKDEVLSAGLRLAIEDLLTEDHKVLKRLADA